VDLETPEFVILPDAPTRGPARAFRFWREYPPATGCSLPYRRASQRRTSSTNTAPAGPDGGGFALNAFSIIEDLHDPLRRAVVELPLDPLFVSVAESRDAAAQDSVSNWARRAAEVGVSYWGRST
jgi:hypothetical protein